MTIRVTDSYLSSILLGDLNRSLGHMLEQQRMAGSMRRVNDFADDPRAVSTIQRYNSLIASNSEYLTNVTRSRIMVDGTDVALNNISEVLADVRVIALRESSAIATEQSQETSVIEVDNLVNRLMDVLNTSIEGNYLFSGRQLSTQPFTRSGNTVIYQGDREDITARTGPNTSMTLNIHGDVLLGTQSSTLGGTVDMAPRIDGTTPLTALNLGEGWHPGRISLTGGNGNTYQVDLSGAVTVNDLITTVNAATAGQITLSIQADGSGLELAGTGPLVVGEIDEGRTAASLGLNGVSDGNSYMGRDIRPMATAATNLADIQSLAGHLPLGVMNINWQGADHAVDFSAATTLGDLQTTLNGAIPGMTIQIQGSGISLVGGSPEAFTVTNADATNTASVLGIEGAGSPVRLFGMLEDLKTGLDTGDKDAIRGVMTELSHIEDTVYQLIMKNGGRQTDLDWAEGILMQRDERLKANLSLEYDADVAQVAADLKQAEASYQASLLVTSKLYSANLIQFLR
ncbi:hypothetical protein CSA17_05725 [bacterium DOLJORAL78_65_58]|nr:MAG: hypothetical protein CSB20_08805 [bacterium DOLZORAL124_64_63]PIE75771.1 MAG: hypothetical protein CSA17_05725 [bacterium DOLJORAL78_65_58]